MASKEISSGPLNANFYQFFLAIYEFSAYDTAWYHRDFLRFKFKSILHHDYMSLDNFSISISTISTFQQQQFTVKKQNFQYFKYNGHFRLVRFCNLWYNLNNLSCNFCVVYCRFKISTFSKLYQVIKFLKFYQIWTNWIVSFLLFRLTDSGLANVLKAIIKQHYN